MTSEQAQPEQTYSADDLRDLAEDAAHLIEGMSEWMRCVLPGQVEPGTAPEREQLLADARKWRAGFEEVA